MFSRPNNNNNNKLKLLHTKIGIALAPEGGMVASGDITIVGTGVNETAADMVEKSIRVVDRDNFPFQKIQFPNVVVTVDRMKFQREWGRNPFKGSISKSVEVLHLEYSWALMWR